jgi:hypothetical protein
MSSPIHHTFDSEVELALNQQQHELDTNNIPQTVTSSSSSPSFNDTNNFVTKIKTSTKHSISFLIAVFDNIVGPKCLHFWSTHLNDFDNYLLKYIAVHTLNGELYNQEKLINSFKFRFYSIKEVNYSLLTIFFDANTIFTQNHYQLDQRKGSSSSLNYMQLTVLNCFSIIVPLEFQQYLLDKAEFISSAFENYILEFKVFAEVWEKRNNVTVAVSYLAKCVEDLCANFETLECRGIKNINVISLEIM